MTEKMNNAVKKLTLMALLAAIALIIFIAEAQIPLPLPIPGAKLGLSNTVTLFALFYNCAPLRPTPAARIASRNPLSYSPLRPKPAARIASRNPLNCAPSPAPAPASAPAPTLTAADALLVLLCRIILGAVFSGRIVAFIYSAAGGLLAFAAQALMRRFVTPRQIWACGAVGAVFHNIGQISAAMLITGTTAIAAYLPVLAITGIITGIITGAATQLALERIRNY